MAPPAGSRLGMKNASAFSQNLAQPHLSGPPHQQHRHRHKSSRRRQHRSSSPSRTCVTPLYGDRDQGRVLRCSGGWSRVFVVEGPLGAATQNIRLLNRSGCRSSRIAPVAAVSAFFAASKNSSWVIWRYSLGSPTTVVASAAAVVAFGSLAIREPGFPRRGILVPLLSFSRPPPAPGCRTRHMRI